MWWYERRKSKGFRLFVKECYLIACSVEKIQKVKSQRLKG